MGMPVWVSPWWVVYTRDGRRCIPGMVGSVYPGWWVGGRVGNLFIPLGWVGRTNSLYPERELHAPGYTSLMPAVIIPAGRLHVAQ